MAIGDPKSVTLLNFDDIVTTYSPILNRQLFLTDHTLPDTSKPLRFACTQIQSCDIDPRDRERFTTYKRPTEFVSKHREYVVYLFGTLSTGQAATIRVRGFKPYFYVDIGNVDPTIFRQLADQVLKTQVATHVPIATLGMEVEIEPMYLASEGYRPFPRPIAKISANSLQAASQIASAFKSFRVINKSQLGANFHRVFIRDRSIKSGNWLEVHDAKQYRFGDLAAQTNNSILHYEAHYEQLRTTDDMLKGDLSIIMSWDIETSSPGNSVPLWTNAADMIEIACYNFYQYAGEKPLLCIGLTTKDTGSYAAKYADRPTVIIKCANQYQLLKMHSYIIGRFQPAFVIGFADSQYDWPWVFYRAEGHTVTRNGRQLSILPEWYVTMCYSECGFMQFKQFDAKAIRVRFEKLPAVKIDASTKRDVRYLITDGYICLDVQTMLIQRYNKSQVSGRRSMNHFAEIVLKRKKVDISEHSPDERIRRDQDSYAEMRRILRLYDESAGGERDGIDLLIYYCFVDGELPHLMMLKMASILEHRSFCNEAFIRMEDSMVRANGMKVGSAVQYYAIHEYRRLSGAPLLYNVDNANREQEDESKEKINGALVIKPKLGLETMVPISGLDIESLYPSIIITYNICHSQMIAVCNEGDIMDYRQSIDAVEQLGWNNVNEFAFDYRGREYQFWTRKHFGDDRRIGILPFILRRFRDLRRVLKEVAAMFADFAVIVEANLKEVDPAFTKLRATLTKWRRMEFKNAINSERMIAYCERIEAAVNAADTAVIAAIIGEINDFRNLAKFQSEAVKVMMNSFYGVMAMPQMFMYNLYLSSAVTSVGQTILRAMQRRALREGFVVCYGDTDSMYVRRAYEYYSEFIGAYHNELDELSDLISTLVSSGDVGDSARARELMVAAKRRYYERVITHSIADMKALCKIINAFLATMHDGIASVTIAYEEVLLPSMFLNKKIYIGFQHTTEPMLNVTIDKMSLAELEKIVLIRGLAMKKRGYSPLVVDVSMRIVKQLMDPFSDTSVGMLPAIKLVENELLGVMRSDVWTNLDQFAKVVTYKRLKHNPAVQDFVAKLRARNDPQVPEDGDHMKVIVTETDLPRFDMFGKRQKISRGQTYEFLHRAKELGIPIDRGYYLEAQLLNPLVLFIMYHFNTPTAEAIDDYDDWRETIAGAAEKHLRQLINRESADMVDTSHAANRFMRDLVKAATGPLQIALSSTFSHIANGQFFRLQEDTPAVLVLRDSLHIIDAITSKHRRTVSQNDIIDTDNLRGRDELKSALDEILPRAREAYLYLRSHIIMARQERTPLPQIEFDQQKIITINDYVDILQELRVANSVAAKKARQLSLATLT